ncbi:MAG: universal stress protein [Cellvibrionales bacterium]|nr:universal stress protein [Cellvibrionales bacterium]
MKAYERILVAVDLEQESQGIIERAAAISSAAKVSVVHVVLPLSQAFYANGLGLVQPMVDLAKLEEEIIDKAMDDLSQYVSGVPSDGRIHYDVKKGDVVDTIVDTAKESQADLIVLGSHGTSGIKLLLGSTANGVLHHAPCDTLMIKI